MSNKKIVLGPGEGKIIPVPGHKMTIKLSGEDIDGAFSLLEIELTGDVTIIAIYVTVKAI